MFTFKKRGAHYSVRQSELYTNKYKIVIAYDNHDYEDINMGYFNSFESAHEVAIKLNDLKYING